MTLSEIKKAVESGKTVYWKNPSYEVVKQQNGEWVIKCTLNNNYIIGLTWTDGETMNGKPEDFLIND